MTLMCDSVVILQREFRYQSLLGGVKALIQILRSIINTSPVDWMPIHCNITPQYLIQLPEQVTHLDSWVEGDTVTEKCFAQRMQKMTQPGIKPTSLNPEPSTNQYIITSPTASSQTYGSIAPS